MKRMKLRLLAITIGALCAGVGLPAVALVPPAVVREVLVIGKQLIVRVAGKTVTKIDDVTTASGTLLREALEGVTDAAAMARVARVRFPNEVSEQAIRRLASVSDQLGTVPGAEETMRLLVAENLSNVKGALAELELAAFLMKRKDVAVKEVRRFATTKLGALDIDVVASYKGVDLLIEKKAIDGLRLTDDLVRKMDKMKELAKPGSIPILSVREIPPASDVLRYAAKCEVRVVWGGMLKQTREIRSMAEAAASRLPVTAP